MYDSTESQLARVRSEFREMPELALKRAQASRLFGLDPAATERVLSQLVDCRFLQQKEDGTFKRRGS